MRTALMLAVALSAFAVAAQAAAPTLEIRDAAVRVTVSPEPRADIVVEVLRVNPALPLKIRRSKRKTIISGGLPHGIRGCPGDGPASTVTIAGAGEAPYGSLPQLLVRVPMEVHIAAGGAVFGEVGRAASLELGNAGCGDWVVANVQGALTLTEAGSGDVRVGAAGSARLRVAGEGDLSVGAVRGGVDAEIGGAGDIRVRSLSGPFVARIAGSGDIRVGGGATPLLTASVAGPGSIYFAGVAQSVKARVVGSGDVEVAQVTGPVSRSILGPGQVRIGRRRP